MKFEVVNPVREKDQVVEFVDWPLPYHVAGANTRRTAKGTWVVSLWGRMHESSNMPPARDRLYYPAHFTRVEAVTWACDRVKAKFEVREAGSNLVHFARQVLHRITDRRWIQDIADSLFGDWIYQDMKATTTVAFGIDLLSSRTWDKLQVAAYLRQAKINMEVL